MAGQHPCRDRLKRIWGHSAITTNAVLVKPVISDFCGGSLAGTCVGRISSGRVPVVRRVFQGCSRPKSSHGAAPHTFVGVCGLAAKGTVSMCGRVVQKTPLSEIRALFETVNPILNSPPNFKAEPTQILP